MLAHTRENDEALQAARSELQARRHFVGELTGHVVASDQKLAAKREIARRIPAWHTLSGSISREHMPSEATLEEQEVLWTDR